MKSKYIHNSLIVALFLLFIVGCAKHNAGIVKQTYHDLTGHYNTYFNAQEMYNETIQSIEENRTEDYNQILPLYAYGTTEDTKAHDSEFQTAQEKATKSIQLHQISNWADDAFLLVGKTYYMQGDFEKAAESFRYITANYKEGVDGRSEKKIKKQKSNKKRKAKIKKQEDKELEALQEGKDIRPSNGIFKHEPSRSEALVWLVKAFSSNAQYTEADAVITFIHSDYDFYKNYDKDVEIATAFYYLEQERYEKGVEHIEIALEQIKRQKKKTRYQFILGQLYATLGNQAKAAEYFEQSIKANPDFEMQFYAKLNLIKMSREGGYEEKAADKLIAKLLRDKKNRDFYDQLYYEKALIALDNNEKEEAKELLQKSIESSINNNTQKANSYILLADLNYQEELYRAAQALYDSSLTLINIDYEDYYFVQNRSLVLTNLVEQLDIIRSNDSLLLIASMEPKDREDYLYKLAVDLIEEEDKANQNSGNPLVASNTTSNTKTAWYFYSESLRNKGYKKFQSTWGERVLEDNWRRKDKTSSDFALEDEESDQSNNNTDFFARVTAKYEAMLEEIPTTPEEKITFHAEIKNAYFESAMIYKDGLENIPKSIEMLETLNRRYPNNDNKLETYYNLYLLYDKIDDIEQSNRYKNLLLGTYPDSDFAKIIKDPDYIKNLEEKDSEATHYYEATYVMFGKKQYDQVVTRCEDAISLYPTNSLQAKFDLLKALAIGGKKQREEYENALEYVVNKHKNTEEQAKAAELLAYLRGEEIEEGTEAIDLYNNDTKIEQIENNTGNEVEKIDKKDDKFKFKFGEKEIKVGDKKNKKVEDINLETE